MTSVVFETERFRVHITGKAAWVEAKDGANWVFCNWHALPVSSACSDSDALKAAVTDYEEARGENSLRIALTGIGHATVKPAIKQQPARPPRIASPAHSKKASGYYGFRAPLRPPLLSASSRGAGSECP